MVKLLYVVFILSTLHFVKSNYQQECLTETGIDYQTLRKEFAVFQVSEDNEVIATFFTCLWKKNGIMNTEGVVDVFNFRDYFLTLVSKYRNMPVSDTFKTDIKRFIKNGLFNFCFGDSEAKDSILVVNNIKMGFFAITFADRGGGRSILEIIME